MGERIKGVSRRYEIEPLPLDESLDRYAVPFAGEAFTKEQEFFLKPFFSNLDGPVYVIHHLPEEVVGALSSRYSRSTKGLRRLFWDEYLEPILSPEKQKGWEVADDREREEALSTSRKLREIVDFLNRTGGVDGVVNIKRGRKFFETWLSEFGDDSIAEQGAVHVSIEGISNMALEELVNKRIGISLIIKSSRYVQFWERRADGGDQYVVPGELVGTEYEAGFREVMDGLFGIYERLAGPYLDYIKELYPKGEDETDKSFQNSRSAKRFDDLRDLLPFGTQVNGGFLGNCRAWEEVINRLAAHPLGELRWLGQALCNELEKEVPSFVKRPRTARGAEIQLYLENIRRLRRELATGYLTGGGNPDREKTELVRLLSSTPNADVEILSAFMFAGCKNIPLHEVRSQVMKMTPDIVSALLGTILGERKFGKSDPGREEVRFRKVPRAFENAKYLFEIWGRGGDFRDLHRHRMLTEEHQQFTTRWGFDLEEEVRRSPFVGEISSSLERAARLYEKLEADYPEAASYVVPFAFIQHWYMLMTAREVFWTGEIRTGPQARPHYKEICLQIVDLAMKETPAVFQGIMVDRNDYRLARRDSERRVERKRGVEGA